MVALPGQLFTNTQIPACIWFLSKNKKARTSASSKQLRDRSGEVLFIDARKLGYMKDRVLRDFTQDDLNKVTETFHLWQTVGWGEERTPANTKDNADINAGLRDKAANPAYKDIPGFCKSAQLEEIKKHDYVLTPGRYVGAAPEEDDGEPFADKMARLTGQLKVQFEESERLEGEIKKNLAGLGYEC
jgi:type I restriction enzyme M protein